MTGVGITRRRLLRDGGTAALGLAAGGSLIEVRPLPLASARMPAGATEIIGYKGEAADFDFGYSPAAAAFIERPRCDDWDANRFSARCARAADRLHRAGKELYCFVQFRQRNTRVGGVAYRELGFVAPPAAYGGRRFDPSLTYHWMRNPECGNPPPGPGDPAMRRVNQSIAPFRRRQVRALRTMVREGHLDGFFVDQQGKLVYELGLVPGSPGYEDMPLRDDSPSHAAAYQRLIGEIRRGLPRRARLIGNGIDGVTALGLGPHGMSEAVGENFAGRDETEADPVGWAMDYVLDRARRPRAGYRFWGFDKSRRTAVCRRTYLIAAVFDWGYMHVPCEDGPFVPNPEPGPPRSPSLSAGNPADGSSYRLVRYRHFRDATVVANAAPEPRDVVLDDGRHEQVAPREVTILPARA